VGNDYAEAAAIYHAYLDSYQPPQHKIIAFHSSHQQNNTIKVAKAAMYKNNMKGEN